MCKNDKGPETIPIIDICAILCYKYINLHDSKVATFYVGALFKRDAFEPTIRWPSPLRSCPSLWKPSSCCRCGSCGATPEQQRRDCPRQKLMSQIEFDKTCSATKLLMIQVIWFVIIINLQMVCSKCSVQLPGGEGSKATLIGGPFGPAQSQLDRTHHSKTFGSWPVVAFEVNWALLSAHRMRDPVSRHEFARRAARFVRRTRTLHVRHDENMKTADCTNKIWQSTLAVWDTCQLCRHFSQPHLPSVFKHFWHPICIGAHFAHPF